MLTVGTLQVSFQECKGNSRMVNKGDENTLISSHVVLCLIEVAE